MQTSKKNESSSKNKLQECNSLLHKYLTASSKMKTPMFEMESLKEFANFDDSDQEKSFFKKFSIYQYDLLKNFVNTEIDSLKKVIFSFENFLEKGSLNVEYTNKLLSRSVNKSIDLFNLVNLNNSERDFSKNKSFLIKTPDSDEILRKKFELTIDTNVSSEKSLFKNGILLNQRKADNVKSIFGNLNQVTLTKKHDRNYSTFCNLKNQYRVENTGSDRMINKKKIENKFKIGTMTPQKDAVDNILYYYSGCNKGVSTQSPKPAFQGLIMNDLKKREGSERFFK